MVRRAGIEPASQAWEAHILPMNYRRIIQTEQRGLKQSLAGNQSPTTNTSDDRPTRCARCCRARVENIVPFGLTDPGHIYHELGALFGFIDIPVSSTSWTSFGK